MAAYLWIAIGSALGGMARYWRSGVAARLIGETFPWGTLIVNVVGSFIIGFFATLTGPDGRVLVGTTARQFVMVGLCGGYTTFSSFARRRVVAGRRQYRGVGRALPGCGVDRPRHGSQPQHDEMGVTMQIPRDAVLLRIFIGEDRKHERAPLYEAIVLKAREMHMAGATVLRGPMGFGHSSRLHTAKILRLSEDLPVVIEIVDSPDRVDAFLPVLDAMMSGGLVTIEKVQVLQYGNARPEKS